VSRPTSSARTLVHVLRPAAGRWFALGGLVAVGSALALAGPLVVRRVIDRASQGATVAELRTLGLVFLLIAVARQVAAVVTARAATSIAWRTTNDFRLEMTRHVLGLDHEFHRTHTPGELIQRVDGDITAVNDLCSRVLTRVVGSALLVLGMVAVVAAIDWRVGLGTVVYLASAVSIVLAMRHRAVRESVDELGAYARLYGGIEERLTAAEDLRSNGAGPHAMWRFVEESAGALDTSVRRESAFLAMWWSVQGAATGGVVLAIGAGALLVGQGSMTVGTAFLLFQYVLLVQRPLEEVIHELETVQKATGAMRRVSELLATSSTIVDQGTTTPPAGPIGIDFDDVSFDYGDDVPVLRDVNVSIGAGRSVGIVGRTGSGKTTFSRLVLRLVEATSGTVRIGGVPIAATPLAELRRRVALVPQEVELFHGSVRDNVTLFDPDADDERVADALRRVGLGRIADAGIHQTLGAGGAGLSAGESQLLALARVWLVDPDLMVLDEATARVDPETEAHLDAAVRDLMRNRTTLVIAHRLSTLREVDDIAVFEAGRLVEFGPRERLAADPTSRFHRLLTVGRERLDAAETDGIDTGEAEGMLV
jgi:ATP-binding cassette, subfamily B, bacterial